MKFDKSRVYTAVNADELKVGSKCLFADTVKSLKEIVQYDDPGDYVETFYGLYDGLDDVRFWGESYCYTYAYLIDPPAEPKYKPFESVEKAMNAIKKHGGWVKDVEAHRSLLVHAYENNDSVNKLMVGFSWISLQDLYEIFVFDDDGSPCGELVEEK